MIIEEKQNDPLYSAFAYDDAFRTMETECDGILEKYNNTREKVDDVMGGEIFDLPEIRAYHEGESKGRTEGQTERDALEAEIERFKKKVECLGEASV